MFGNIDPTLSPLDPTDTDAQMHLVIREGTWYHKIAWKLNAREFFPNNIPIMGPGLRVGKEAALAVQRAKTEFINGARNGPLQIVICSPDPAGHGGTYFRSCTTYILLYFILRLCPKNVQ